MTFKKIIYMHLIIMILLGGIPVQSSNFDDWCEMTGAYSYTGVTVFYIESMNNSDTAEINEIKQSDILQNNARIENSLSNTQLNKLTVSSQIYLDNVNVGEQGMRIKNNANMRCQLDFYNNSISERTVTAILATYTEDNKLNKIKKYEIIIDPYSNGSAELTYCFDDSDATGKIMMWDSLWSISPIRASIDFTQTSGINAYYYNADNRLLQIDKANGKSLIFTYDNMGNLLSKTVRE